MDKKAELMKNLRCTPEQAAAILDTLRDMAHDGTIPPAAQVHAASIAAARQWEPAPECAMAGRMRK